MLPTTILTMSSDELYVCSSLNQVSKLSNVSRRHTSYTGGVLTQRGASVRGPAAPAQSSSTSVQRTKDDALGTAVVRARERAEPLLAGRVLHTAVRASVWQQVSKENEEARKRGSGHEMGAKPRTDNGVGTSDKEEGTNNMGTNNTGSFLACEPSLSPFPLLSRNACYERNFHAQCRRLSFSRLPRSLPPFPFLALLPARPASFALPPSSTLFSPLPPSPAPVPKW